MKNISKILVIALALMAFSAAMFALEQTVGLRFGCSHPKNDINVDNPDDGIVNFMTGLNYEAWLKDYISMGIYPYYTKLQNDANTNGYAAKVIGAEIQARFRPTKVAVVNFNDGALQRISPYAQIGIGAAYVDNDNMLDGQFAFLAPTAGLGLSFQTKWNIDFDLGVQLDHALTDEIDNQVGGSDIFTDAHMMPYLGIGYTFGKKGGSSDAVVSRLLRNVVSMEQDFTLDGVQFEFNSSKLTGDAKVVLQEVIEAMKKNPNVRLEIHGHSDNVGDPAYNITLSQERAQSVKDYMVQNGISANRLTTKGFGMNKPIASNSTPEGRALNRRIEFVIVK